MLVKVLTAPPAACNLTEESNEGPAEMQTASELIAEAMKANAIVAVDHRTSKFIGYAIDMKDGNRKTVVRVHIDSIENSTLAAML